MYTSRNRFPRPRMLDPPDKLKVIDGSTSQVNVADTVVSCNIPMSNIIWVNFDGNWANVRNAYQHTSVLIEFLILSRDSGHAFLSISRTIRSLNTRNKNIFEPLINSFEKFVKNVVFKIEDWKFTTIFQHGKQVNNYDLCMIFM